LFNCCDNFYVNHDEIDRQKKLTQLPIKKLPEESLEIPIEQIYRPGSALDMPIRPAWTYSRTKEQLEQQEQTYFNILAGIHPIAQVQEPYTAVGYLVQWLPMTKILKLGQLEHEKQNYSAMDICEERYASDPRAIELEHQIQLAVDEQKRPDSEAFPTSDYGADIIIEDINRFLVFNCDNDEKEQVNE
ncbi:unnamed protein product, partial [Rotaria sp. Silwood2]